MSISKYTSFYFPVFLFICFTFKISANAQKYKLNHYSVAITTLHTNLPFGSFSGLFSKEYHPGIEISTGFIWKEKPKHDWYHEFSFGYSYHRWVQHSISLYTSAGYRYKFPKKFYAEISIGAGYLHAIADSKLFKLQSDGSYKKKFNWGRPQAMAALSISIGKSFVNGMAVFLNYEQRLQTPFIKSYVSILPSDMMLIGAKIPFHKK